MNPEPKPEREKTVAERLEELRGIVEAHGRRRPPPVVDGPDPIAGWLRWGNAFADPVIEEIQAKVVYTLGHHRLPWDEFLRRLRRWEISVVVDVREQPWSNRTCYGQGSLREGLREEAIGYRRWPQLCSRAGRSYHYQDGLLRLLDRIAEERAVVLLCVEENPRECHRWTIVGRDLAELGIKVKHIRTRMAY